MKKVILLLDCGVGMHSADSYLVSQEEWDKYNKVGGPLEEDTLSLYAWEAAVEFASGYGIYPEIDRSDDSDEDSWISDQYSNDIAGWFEEYDPKEHDGLMIGNQREWDWREL